MNRGIIDVGSNSIRLMLIIDGKPIHQELATTQLGRGLLIDGNIDEEAFSQSIDAIDMFVRKIRNIFGEVSIFGTAALRNAKNAKQFVMSVYSRVGERIDIISSKEEAEIGYIGAVKGNIDKCTVIDIGGASTEIALGENLRVSQSTSLEIGAIKIFSKCKNNRKDASQYINELLGKIEIKEIFGKVIAIGGTCTSIAMLLDGSSKYSKEITDGFEMNLNELKNLVDKLYLMTADERNSLTNIRPKRREIICGGALLLQKIMEKLGVNSIITSESDNLIGYYLVNFNE